MSDADPRFTALVDQRSQGIRLDRFLAGPLGSRAQAARLIGAGLVRVDGLPAAKGDVLSPGQLVTVAPEPDPTPSDAPQATFGIVWEDEFLVVVDKPAGVVVHPGRGHMSGTLAQALADRAAGGAEPGRAGIVHRLDRDTSGLLVVSKSEGVHRALKEQLASRALRREYLALVEGVPPARTGTIEAPIGRSRRDRVLMSIDTDAPREAVTHFEQLEVLGDCTLLKVVLDTGRTHQIRVHLAAIGHPVCGDRQYGGSSSHGLRRQFLHAARLSFKHPITGEAIDVSSPLPDDLMAALANARRTSAIAS